MKNLYFDKIFDKDEVESSDNSISHAENLALKSGAKIAYENAENYAQLISILIDPMRPHSSFKPKEGNWFKGFKK
ncbi:hypothetical protein [Desulfobacter curvatus]|uniref:hypothetical protein n=1 Tax=Desulfobacter curvatus TaxID=2290 RepID=UPI00036ACF71|nr:hypothetical protein [Desulfobacter curvatus]